jgi:hypothetical protein
LLTPYGFIGRIGKLSVISPADSGLAPYTSEVEQNISRHSGWRVAIASARLTVPSELISKVS